MALFVYMRIPIFREIRNNEFVRLESFGKPFIKLPGRRTYIYIYSQERACYEIDDLDRGPLSLS